MRFRVNLRRCYAMLNCPSLHGSERQPFGLIMNKNSRVFHERGFTMKRSAAEKSVREGNLAWTEDGLIRQATYEEIYDSMTGRAAERAKIAQSLGHREVSGLIFEPSAAGIPATRREKFLAWQARHFVKFGVMPDLEAA